MGVGPAAPAQDLFPASPPALSLLRVPGVIATESDTAPPELGGRWLTGGITHEPERCALQLDPDTATADYPYWWQCPPDGGQTPEEALTAMGSVKAIGTNPAEVAAEPWTAWVGFACSSMGLVGPREAEVRSRLLRHLEACLPAIIERELWTGAVATFMGASNPFLADAGAVTEISSSLGFVTALGELEQALAECACGKRHMIHAQPRVVTAWVAAGLVSLSPDRTHMLTEMGTVVVPGTGYPGTSPAGATPTYSVSWAYGTGPVRVYLGDATVNRVDSTTVTRPTNDVELRAERPALVVFDDACCHVSTGVSLNDLYAASGS